MPNSTVLDATAKGASANSFLTVARAEEVLRTGRLYTDVWDDANEDDAEDYQAAAAGSVGAIEMPVDTGYGNLRAKRNFKFNGHATVYTLQNELEDQQELQTIRFEPPLTDAVADDETIVRLSGSEKERALIWSTYLLDISMDWYGAPTTIEQALRFPRTGLVDADGNIIDGDTVPFLVERAAAELSVVLLTKDRTAEPKLLGLGFREAKLGDLSVVVDHTQVVDLIPAFILTGLDVFGKLKAAADRGSRIVELGRG